MKIRLKFWRLRRGMSMQQLADAASIGSTTIVRIEKYGHIPQARTLNKLAETLHISLEELLVEDDETEKHLAKVS